MESSGESDVIPNEKKVIADSSNVSHLVGDVSDPTHKGVNRDCLGKKEDKLHSHKAHSDDVKKEIPEEYITIKLEDFEYDRSEDNVEINQILTEDTIKKENCGTPSNLSLIHI